MPGFKPLIHHYLLLLRYQQYKMCRCKLQWTVQRSTLLEQSCHSTKCQINKFWPYVVFNVHTEWGQRIQGGTQGNKLRIEEVKGENETYPVIMTLQPSPHQLYSHTLCHWYGRDQQLVSAPSSVEKKLYDNRVSKVMPICSHPMNTVNRGAHEITIYKKKLQNKHWNGRKVVVLRTLFLRKKIIA